MNPHKQLRELARLFHLKYQKKRYVYLVCTKREIIMRNFIGGCPDPLYVQYGNTVKTDRPKALISFLNSKDYENELRKPHGCVVHRFELRKELNIISAIEDDKLRQEVQILYNKIQRKMGKNKRLSLIWNASRSEKKIENEVILHEFTHELLEDNGLRLGSWKWNEGLVTYMTHVPLGTYTMFEKQTKPTGKKMWDIYASYAHRWTLLLRDIKDPFERRRTINKKVQETKGARRTAKRNTYG